MTTESSGSQPELPHPPSLVAPSKSNIPTLASLGFASSEQTIDAAPALSKELNRAIIDEYGSLRGTADWVATHLAFYYITRNGGFRIPWEDLHLSFVRKRRQLLPGLKAVLRGRDDEVDFFLRTGSNAAGNLEAIARHFNAWET